MDKGQPDPAEAWTMEIRKAGEELERKLSSFGGWERIEAAGKVSLPETLRAKIDAFLRVQYVAPPPDSARRKQERKKLIKLAEDLNRIANAVDQLVPTEHFDFEFGGRSYPEIASIHLSPRMRMLAKALYPPNKRKGKRERDEDFRLIIQIAEVYHLAGGRVAYSESGPFASFIKAIWNLLPRHQQHASASTFARLAQKIPDNERRRIADLPREVTINRTQNQSN